MKTEGGGGGKKGQAKDISLLHINRQSCDAGGGSLEPHPLQSVLLGFSELLSSGALTMSPP
jgi:hypothetical protein